MFRWRYRLWQARRGGVAGFQQDALAPAERNFTLFTSLPMGVGFYDHEIERFEIERYEISTGHPRTMISAIHLFDEHTPQPIPPVNDDDDDDDDKVKPGSGGGNIDPDDDEGGSDDDDDEEDETLWTDEDVQWQRMM
jgi:hypothetical protein